jgi:hypothetical protein
MDRAGKNTRRHARRPYVAHAYDLVNYIIRMSPYRLLAFMRRTMMDAATKLLPESNMHTVRRVDRVLDATLGDRRKHLKSLSRVISFHFAMLGLGVDATRVSSVASVLTGVAYASLFVVRALEHMCACMRSHRDTVEDAPLTLLSLPPVPVAASASDNDDEEHLSDASYEHARDNAGAAYVDREQSAPDDKRADGVATLATAMMMML